MLMVISLSPSSGAGAGACLLCQSLLILLPPSRGTLDVCHSGSARAPGLAPVAASRSSLALLDPSPV